MNTDTLGWSLVSCPPVEIQSWEVRMRRTDIIDFEAARLIEKGLKCPQIFDESFPTVVTGEHEEAGVLILVYLPEKVVMISDLRKARS
jgi:hypothetical protein